MAKRRLFIGTFLPEAQRSALTVEPAQAARLGEEWRRKIRWVRADKFHLTWVFLGSIDDEKCAEIESAMQRAVQGFGAVDLTYASLKLWPHPRKPRTFVLVPDAVPQQLMELAESIKKEMLPFAERIEPNFRPHITLARTEPHGGRVDVPEWLGIQAPLPLTQHIDSVQLIESDLRGAKDYKAIASWPLL
jgi:2'-5' RNA ligase